MLAMHSYGTGPPSVPRMGNPVDRQRHMRTKVPHHVPSGGSWQPRYTLLRGDGGRVCKIVHVAPPLLLLSNHPSLVPSTPYPPEYLAALELPCRRRLVSSKSLLHEANDRYLLEDLLQKERLGCVDTSDDRYARSWQMITSCRDVNATATPTPMAPLH